MNQEQPPGEKIGRGMLLLAWVLGLGLLTLVFGVWEEKKYNPNARPEGTVDGNRRQVVLQRNRSGHYVATGSINGEQAVFLLDTGATDVVISQDLAQQAGLQAGATQYAQTANGRIQVRATKVEQLTLGPISLRDVRASINPAMSGETVLLGMSALQQVEFTQRGDQLTLRHYSSEQL